MLKVSPYCVAACFHALLFSALLLPTDLFCQAKADSAYRVVTPGPQYNKTNFYRWLWGDHYREVWTTPVKVGYFNLDTIGGGLTPVRRGGGNQTRTLHLKGANGQDYVLRSIDKFYGQALPAEYKGTFIERIIADQASTAHPYAAFTIPPMISEAGIYHSKPVLGIVPDHPKLDSFRKEFGNMLALLEERADDDETRAAHFGYSANVVGTDKMLENLTKDHKYQVDQLAYVKARIFDMFVGDWGRHEDQWRWASFKEGDKILYKPIPRDRDQAYTLFDGFLLKRALSAAKLKHLQSFDHDIKNVAKYNFPARYLDRRLAVQPVKEDWLRLARELQHALTDSVIRYAVNQMPDEAFQKSGEEIIAKLISRRNALEEFADLYYQFLSKEVEVVGSDKTELFIIERLSDGQTKVVVKGMKENQAETVFERIFLAEETQEVRLYGLDGNDQFQLKGEGRRIKVRIIGGEGTDVTSGSYGAKPHHIYAYDNQVPGVQSEYRLPVRVTSDTLKNRYDYKRFNYDKKGLKFKPGTTVGIGYSATKQKWGMRPYGYEHSLMFEWTFTRGGFALVYRGQYNEVLGKWGLAPILRYDFPYVDHFFGIGNNTARLTDTTKNSFYRMHTKEWLAGLGINRRIDSHFIQLQPYYQSVELDVRPGKFLDLFVAGVPLSDRGKKTFGGVELMYRYQERNDPLMPTKGFGFTAAGNYIVNFTDTNRDITRYSGAVWGYIPLFRNTSLAIRVGGATLNGDPVFYQMNSLGGNINLRGYARRRFFGTSSGYNNNEIRWLANTSNRLFTGKIGLLAFFDQGRIWQKNETSDQWHYGYGGGLVIVPFRRAVLNGTVGFGDEKPVIHARIGFLF